ncbi:hypothetical protein KC361_g7362 [Hortaea werneckii]|nr:hypothetical protein KC361_g7362 [Hortaea werneckii]
MEARITRARGKQIAAEARAREENARAEAAAAAAAPVAAAVPAAEGPAADPAEGSADQLRDGPRDEPGAEPAAEPGTEPGVEPGAEPADEPADEATDEAAGESAGQAPDEEVDLSISTPDKEDNPMSSKRKSDDDMGSRRPKRPRTSHQSGQAGSDGDVGNAASRQELRPEADEQDNGEETARSSNGAQRGIFGHLNLRRLLRFAQDAPAQPTHQTDSAGPVSETTSELRYPPLPADVPAPPASKAKQIESTQELGYMEVGPAPEEWNFVQSLGRGTYGRACLWVKRDNSHTIIDRAVIKESYLLRESWESNWHWWDNQVPWEAHIHERLSKLDRGRRSIVDFRNHRVFTELAMFRLYMEFGSGGTLNDLIERHARIRDTKAADGQVLEPHIPVRFIWSAFEAMARTACLMKSGSVIHSDPDNWESLVHRDIKPANILIMHAPRPPADPWWPSLPLLGDFGMMVREDIQGYENPSEWINVGTELYCAPEQSSKHRQPKNRYKHKLTPAADVFAIGKVIRCMMQLRNDTIERRPSVLLDYERYDFPEELERRYGRDLVKLVKWCMRPNPERRISSEKLLEGIQEHVNNTESDDEGTPTPLKFQLPSPEEYVSEKKDLYELLSR